jgi:hypothetical protein
MDESALTRVLAALRRAEADGCPVATPTEEVARVAVRRWNSFANRRPQASDPAARTEDLANGLILFASTRSYSACVPTKRMKPGRAESAPYAC